MAMAPFDRIAMVILLGLCFSGAKPVKSGAQSQSLTRYHANGVKTEYREYRLVKAPGQSVPDTVSSGLWIKWDSLGRMSSRQHFLDGVLDGESEEWFPSGKRRVLWSVHGGKMDSGIFWYETGIVANRFRPGPDGDSILVYDESGNLKLAQKIEQVP
jgi:antitoxin component YwqK of YwqJK toxin-antitoxin module